MNSSTFSVRLGIPEHTGAERGRFIVLLEREAERNARRAPLRAYLLHAFAPRDELISDGDRARGGDEHGVRVVGGRHGVSVVRSDGGRHHPPDRRVDLAAAAHGGCGASGGGGRPLVAVAVGTRSRCEWLLADVFGERRSIVAGGGGGAGRWPLSAKPDTVSFRPAHLLRDALPGGALEAAAAAAAARVQTARTFKH